MDDLARRQIQKCALASHRITFEHRRDPVKINGKFPEAACLDIGHSQPNPLRQLERASEARKRWARCAAVRSTHGATQDISAAH
jgi:hypothetical protein